MTLKQVYVRGSGSTPGLWVDDDSGSSAINAELIAHLALLDPTVNPCVTVSGATAGADGRGGVFVNVLTAGGPAIDNKMVFASSNPLWRWVRATQQIEITGSLDLKAYLACNGTTDDQPAMQTVLDNALGNTSATRPARFRLVKTAALGDTLLFNKQSVEIHGGGWSEKSRYTEGGFTGLAGVVGKPLLHFKSCYASRVRDIHLSALAASRASAGIYLEQTAGGGSFVNWCNTFKNIYIGSMEIGTDVAETQFETGVLFGGVNANNETNRFENLLINRPWVGVDLREIQYFGNIFDGLRVHYASKAAVRTNARFVARDVLFLGCGGCTDITAADGVTSAAGLRTLTSASRDFEALGVRRDDNLVIAAGPDAISAYVVSVSGHDLVIDANWPTGGQIGVTFNVIGSVGDLDLIQAGAYIRNYHSEFGARIAQFRSPNGPIALVIDGGDYLACDPGTGGSGINADGMMIKATDATAASIAWDVYLKNFGLALVFGYSGPTPLISMKERAGAASGGRVLLEDCGGITAANIDMNPTWGPGNLRIFSMRGEGIIAQQLLVDGTTLDPALATYEVPDQLRCKRIMTVPRSYPNPPATGAHLKGEIVVDSTGQPWICTSAGSPGAWLKIAMVQYFWDTITPATTTPANVGYATWASAGGANSIMFGGNDGAADDTTWGWNGLDWVNLVPVTTPTARYIGAMCYDAAHAKYVLATGFTGGAVISDTYTYAAGNWTAVVPAHLPAGRYGAALEYSAAIAACVMFGGTDGIGGFFNDFLTWDDVDWTTVVPTFLEWNGAALVPHAAIVGRTGASMCPVPAGFITLGGVAQPGGVLIFGGDRGGGAGGNSDETWFFDGTNCILLAPAASAPARSYHGACYDATRAAVIIFGGVGAGGLDRQDTWEFREGNWVASSVSGTLPTIRQSSQQMIYDVGLAKPVIFGGYHGGPVGGMYGLTYRAP